MTVFFPILLLGFLSSSAAWGGSTIIGSAKISYTLQATLAVNPLASSDLCGRMVSKNSSLYHLQVDGGSSSIQKWTQPLSGTAVISHDSHTYIGTLFDLATQYNSPQFSVLESGTNALNSYLNLNGINYKTVSFSAGDLPIKLHMANNITFFYYEMSIAPYWQFIKTNDLASVSQGQSPAIATEGHGIAISPDHTVLIGWTQNTDVTVYSISGLWMTSVGSFSDSAVASHVNMTQDISFSPDSSMAVIEVDNHKPIAIISLTDLTILHQFTFSSVIERVTFVNNSLLLITTPTQIHLINTTSGNITFLSHIPSSFTTFEWDFHKDTLYLCGNNNINVVSISIEEIMEAGTQISSTSVQQQIVEILDESLSYSSVVTNSFIALALSNPFTYYFLSFINFFNICSHYILLNVPVPPELDHYLYMSYRQSNRNIISQLWTPTIQPLSQEKVTSSRLLDIGLTTDLFTGQAMNLLMVATNITIFQILRCLLRILDRKNGLRRFLYRPLSEILFGQYVSLIMPLTAPWIYYVVGGVPNLDSRINQFLQYTLLCFTLFLTVYFLIFLVNRQKKRRSQKRRSKSVPQNDKKKQSIIRDKSRVPYEKKSKERRNSKTFNNFKITGKSTSKQQKPKMLGKTNRSCARSQKDGDNHPRRHPQVNRNQRSICNRPKIPLRSNLTKVQNKSVGKVSSRKLRPTDLRVTATIIDQWYTVACNFVYPLLMILPCVQVVLGLLLLVSVFGVGIALSLKESRINKTILACYPVLFHLCFIVFNISADETVLIYTHIVCLSTLLLGSIHHVFFLTYLLFKQLSLKCCHSQKTKINKNQKSNEIPKSQGLHRHIAIHAARNNRNQLKDKQSTKGPNLRRTDCSAGVVESQTSKNLIINPIRIKNSRDVKKNHHLRFDDRPKRHEVK